MSAWQCERCRVLLDIGEICPVCFPPDDGAGSGEK